jgi:hypothetical protein
MYQGNIKAKTLSPHKSEEKSNFIDKNTIELNKKKKIFFGITLFFIIISIIYIHKKNLE